MHGGGWHSFIQYDESKGKAQVNRRLLARVMGYGRPYWRSLALMMLAIAVTSLIGLIPPLLYRDLIDNVLVNRDASRLNWLALGMIGIPIVSGLIAEKTSVRPSGGTCLSDAMATTPPAPGRLSTITGVPSCGAARSASARAIASLTPPGG